MNDFEKTLEAKSDQWNAADLMGREIVVTIKSIKVKRSDDQPVTIVLENEEKFYRPSKGMRRVMAGIWNTSDPAAYVGRSLKLYRDPEVPWAGKEVGGICISEASHIKAPMKVTVPVSRTKTKTYTVKPLEVKPQETPAKLDHAALQSEFEASKTMTPEDKKAWWGTKSQDERAVLAEMAKATPSN